MRNIFIITTFLFLANTGFSQNNGYFFDIVGDFDGDDEDELLTEKYRGANQKDLDKIFSADEFAQKEIACSFSSREKNIPSFTAEKSKPHSGFALLHTIGDLDNDGGEEVGYVIDWLDNSGGNTYHIISLKDGEWVELYNLPIREDQLPELPGVYKMNTPFGNALAKGEKTEGEKFGEDQRREKALAKFGGFVKKLSLFNILVKFVNDEGLTAYTLWHLKSGDKKPKSDKASEESLILVGDEVLLPSFTLNLEASPAVQKILKEGEEELILSISCYGKPMKRVDRDAEEYLGDYGDHLYLGDFEFKLNKAGAFVFEGHKIPELALRNLKSPNFSITINGYSSRKTNKQNIFDIEVLSESVWGVGGKVYTLSVDLLK